MKRFAPLLLVVFALAAVPVAFADDPPATPPPVTTTTTTATAPTAEKHPVAHIRIELLRVQLQLVRIRYRLACRKDASSATCTQFTQKATDRLTKLDGNVQKKLAAQQCTSDSTDKKCTVLSKLDQRLQQLITKLGAPAQP